MFNILNHQGNANKNSSEVSPYTGHKVYGKNLRKQQVLERMSRKRNTPHPLVGLQASTTTLEISMVVPEKTT